MDRLLAGRRMVHGRHARLPHRSHDSASRRRRPLRAALVRGLWRRKVGDDAGPDTDLCSRHAGAGDVGVGGVLHRGHGREPVLLLRLRRRGRGAGAHRLRRLRCPRRARPSHPRRLSTVSDPGDRQRSRSLSQRAPDRAADRERRTAALDLLLQARRELCRDAGVDAGAFVREPSRDRSGDRRVGRRASGTDRRRRRRQPRGGRLQPVLRCDRSSHQQWRLRPGDEDRGVAR